MKIIDGILLEIEDFDIIDGVLVIPEGVRVIENNIFADFDVSKIKLPSTLEKIKESTFYHSNIEVLEIPEGVKTIEPNAFYGVYCLKKLLIPGTVENLGYDLLESCPMLEEIILKEGIELIPEGFARHCDNLKKVIIPNSVKSIGFNAFYNCPTLKSIVIPSGVEEIMESAFEKCTGLKEVLFQSGLKKINKYAFEQCINLKKVVLPETLEVIEEAAFRRCSNLREIYLPGSLKTIRNNIVMEAINLTTLVTPWGQHELEGSNTNSLIKSYIYLYVNHLLKAKYQYLDDLAQDEYVGPLLDDKIALLGEKDALYKFKTLYSKMRRSYDITPFLLEALNKETAKHFDYKIWNQIKNIVPWEDFPVVIKAFANMIETFGLFRKDNNQKKRIESFINLFTGKNCRLDSYEYIELLSEYPRMSKKIKESFKEIETVEYFNNTRIDIPKQFAIYLCSLMTEEEIKKRKKISGTFGRELNDFIKKNYKKHNEKRYELISEASSDIRRCLFSISSSNWLNGMNIRWMFDQCDKEYNEDFYSFLIKNMDIILRKSLIQENLAIIQQKFSTIQNYYMYQSGNRIPSLKQVLDYLDSNIFDHHSGCYELALQVKNAGVDGQEIFNAYQEIYEKNQERRLSSLIKRSHIYKINGYRIKAELLRKDDPFAMLVGESNYTNCCQKYQGIGHNCMVHATSNLAGGVFVTKLLDGGEEILLTESWDWQNNNVYCHDNVEGTSYFKKSCSALKKAVAESLRLDGEFIIEKSKEEVEKYIELRKRNLQKLTLEEREKELQKLEELAERTKIKLVTVGDGNDDLNVECFFHDEINIEDESEQYACSPFYALEYDFTNKELDPTCDFYSDSTNTQYIVAGNLNDLFVSHNKPLTPIYRDERRIITEHDKEIRDYTVNKIRNIRVNIDEVKDDFVLKNKKNKSIYLGEDWYVMLKKGESGNIHILDIARTNPTLEDEKGIQLKEIIHTIFSLIKKGKIEAYLKGDRIIKLYQINKKLGYIEPILEEAKEEEVHVIFKEGPNFSHKEPVKVKTI